MIMISSEIKTKTHYSYQFTQW